MKYSDAKTIITWVAACVAFTTGIGLCIGGFFVPPKGEISGSVLTATGEFLTFFSCIFGIGKYAEVQIAKMKKINKSKMEDASEE